MEGWIKLYRKIGDNPLWTSEPFTRAQAWVDLILLANHENGYIYVRGHKIQVKRGQVGWSQNRLAGRWQWSRTKVRGFLKDLEKEQQIKQHKTKSYTVITLINYNEYQSKKQQKNNRKTLTRMIRMVRMKRSILPNLKNSGSCTTRKRVNTKLLLDGIV